MATAENFLNEEQINNAKNYMSEYIYNRTNQLVTITDPIDNITIDKGTILNGKYVISDRYDLVKGKEQTLINGLPFRTTQFDNAEHMIDNLYYETQPDGRYFSYEENDLVEFYKREVTDENMEELEEVFSDLKTIPDREEQPTDTLDYTGKKMFTIENYVNPNRYDDPDFRFPNIKNHDELNAVIENTPDNKAKEFSHLNPDNPFGKVIKETSVLENGKGKLFGMDYETGQRVKIETSSFMAEIYQEEIRKTGVIEFESPKIKEIQQEKLNEQRGNPDEKTAKKLNFLTDSNGNNHYERLKNNNFECKSIAEVNKGKHFTDYSIELEDNQKNNFQHTIRTEKNKNEIKQEWTKVLTGKEWLNQDIKAEVLRQRPHYNLNNPVTNKPENAQKFQSFIQDRPAPQPKM